MVQSSVILKHLRKYRPDWVVDIVVGRGKHTALGGLCHRVYHDQEPRPGNDQYNTVVGIGFYENYCRYLDRPNSKITNCLREVFGLDWDEALGRYTVEIGDQARHKATVYLSSIGATVAANGKYKVVLIHYEGNTSTSKKCLAHWQAQAFCELAIKAGRIPVLLDWDGRSPLPDQKKIFCPRPGPGDIWGNFGSGDAEIIGALIQQSEAFIGIDSGPGKVASATETPTLICWRGHHPIQFHDPAPNTLHLIPCSHRQIPPCCDDHRIAEWFEKHYLYITYDGDHGLVQKAQEWLAQVLGCEDKMSEVSGPVFVLPGGIGDTLWALLKIRAIAGNRPIDVIISGNPSREIDRRSVPFLKRFGFLRNVQVSDVPIHPDRDHPTNAQGRYVYISDGLQGRFHYLIPNTVLERGNRIEDWLPQFECDWHILDHFSWENTEKGTLLGQTLKPFVAFYLGPESGHTDEGHNWGWLWEPKHWISLGRMFKERGMNIAVIGAPYDRSFWEKYVRAGVLQDSQSWIDLIGQMEIGETFALLKEAKCLCAYQSGLGVFNNYMGGKTVMWWRPEGNSGHPRYHLSFSERMKDAWIKPGTEKDYLGCIYTRQTPGDIMAEIDRRKWLE